MRRAFACLALSIGVASVFSSSISAQRDAAPPPARPPLFVCGTDGDRAQQFLGRRPTALAAASPVSFRQEPAVLEADWSGPITLRDFVIAGDVPSLRFQMYAEGSEVETWTRTETRELGGRLVSVFNPTWPASALARVLPRNTWGWDYPIVYWGAVLNEDSTDRPRIGIRLRIAPSTLPTARVVRVADDLQYSGNVVNIVMPGFANGFLDDQYGFDLTGAAQRFYRDFEDSYDSLAFVPGETFLPPSYQGFHRNVRNSVLGIGMSQFDRTASYGSRSGRLQGVELYPGGAVVRPDASSHEIAHQWAAYIDWTRLTGLTRSGHQPESHDPLWAEGETLIGSVLEATRRAARIGDGWQIQRTPAPARFHPFTLYAMGLIGKDDVPEVTLFDHQAQFNPTTSVEPAVGTAIMGATRTATVYNVIGMLGERRGPVPSEWSRATIVVSRDRLITQREMDYWTFFAQRLDDPLRSGTIGYDGVGSFEAATGNRVDLRTDIRPLAGEQIVQAFDVDSPSVGPRDWRDVVFDDRVPMRYRVGETIRWSGHTTAPDRNDFNQMLIRLWKSGGTADQAIQIRTQVSSAASFIAQTSFRPEDRGVYEMEIFLFWPNSGLQYRRASLSPVVIE